MLKKILLLLLIMVMAMPAFAQDEEDDERVDRRFAGRFITTCDDQSCSEVVPTEPGLYEVGLTHDDLKRTYIISIPDSYTGEAAYPLLLVFHGSGQTARSFASKRGDLFKNASDQGYILVFPNGTDLTGRSRWTVDPEREGAADVDDFGFVALLLETLQADLNIDTARIYAAGFSNGGVFTYKLGASMADTFAAIATVGSSIGGMDQETGEVFYPPAPAQPLPVMIVNGRKDTARPWDGGENRTGLLLPAVQLAVDFWVEQNNCAPEPEFRLREVSTTEVYTCEDESQVVFVALDKMTHHWADASRNFGFDANHAILEFFNQFRNE